MAYARAALDHLLVGAPTLEGGIAWLEERTGVRAARGGAHPGLGTWNALASLGPTQYLEIIAPDPNQPGVDPFYVPGLRDFRVPRVAGWAARSDDLHASFTSGLPKAFVCDPPRGGARIRPDGTRLAWSLAFPKHLEHGDFDGALPFFIEWEDAEAHPGRSAPTGLGLHAISLGHPHSTALAEALSAFGISTPVESAATVSIRVELDTPRGRVVL